jgi:hypothetical protein
VLTVSVLAISGCAALQTSHLLAPPPILLYNVSTVVQVFKIGAGIGLSTKQAVDRENQYSKASTAFPSATLKYLIVKETKLNYKVYNYIIVIIVKLRYCKCYMGHQLSQLKWCRYKKRCGVVGVCVCLRA